MASTHLADPDLAIDKYSSTDPGKDAEAFIQLIERKVNFALGDAPGVAGELANYTFRRKALFLVYSEDQPPSGTRNTLPAPLSGRTSEQVSSLDFQTDFRNLLHRIKRTVDEGWPDDMNGIEAAQQNAEREAQGRQRKQNYLDYSLKGLRYLYLQRKAQEDLMENPDATWRDFSTRIIQGDVSFRVSSNFLNNEEQTKAQIASLGQEIMNLRSELQEHRVNCRRRKEVNMLWKFSSNQILSSFFTNLDYYNSLYDVYWCYMCPLLEVFAHRHSYTLPIWLNFPNESQRFD